MYTMRLASWNALYTVRNVDTKTRRCRSSFAVFNETKDPPRFVIHSDPVPSQFFTQSSEQLKSRKMDENDRWYWEHDKDPAGKLRHN